MEKKKKNGGKREGAGRKKASHTITSEARRAWLIERIHQDMPALYDAWLQTALGHVVQKEVQGVERIYDVPPNPMALRDMFERAMGKPVQPVEGKIDTSVDLTARAQSILAKLNAINEEPDRQDDSDVDGDGGEGGG